MPERNLRFYSELVIVTVLSLVAANAWVRLLTQTLNRYYPGSLIVDLLVAIIITAVAVFVLHTFFSDRNNASTDKDEEYPNSLYNY
jgi:hypothetical protein